MSSPDKWTLERISKLIDELLRLGVPISALQGAIDWVLDR